MTAIEKWLCCGRFRRTRFCSDCGRETPPVTIATDATRLADEFAAEASRYYKTADTYANKAESIRIEHKDDEIAIHGEKHGDGNRTWSDIAYQAEQQGLAARSRADKFARYARIINELIEDSGSAIRNK